MRCLVSATWIKTSLLPLYTASWLFASWSRERAVQEVDTWRANLSSLWDWGGRRLSFHYEVSLSCSWERTFAPQIWISFQRGRVKLQWLCFIRTQWHHLLVLDGEVLWAKNRRWEQVHAWSCSTTSFDVGQTLQTLASWDLRLKSRNTANPIFGSLWVHASSARSSYIITHMIPTSLSLTGTKLTWGYLVKTLGHCRECFEWILALQVEEVLHTF